jgi:hypothetical protein
VLFIDCIQSLESGQVYSVMTKDRDGHYRALTQTSQLPSFAAKVTHVIHEECRGCKCESDGHEAGDYLIHIINQQVWFDDQISTITYLKDVTFGVLFEKMKT